ncbi:MAG TPA: class I SAM-dependent methyltransferase [Solirubrobacterales bacterium]|nr:class I SAM-dependent methyltransferase [Solirubrobacterales bacterium]
MSESDFQEASQQGWSDSAKRWARAAEEEETGASADAAAWMLDVADLHPGERVLELACGAGRVGLQAASMVGPDGAVLCSDFSEAMVAAVDERIARMGLTNADTRILDAHHLALGEGETFDLVLCRFGYMLMADPLQALTESGRVLRPGGRLVLAVWGSAEKNPWISTIFDAVMTHLNAPPPEPGTPGPFSLSAAGHLQEMLERAELAEVDITEIETEQTYESLEAWWEYLREVSGPLTALLAALPDADLKAIRTAAVSGAQDFMADDGSVVFPAAVVGAKARKPA